MASPFQQQARRRKFIYAGLIAVLFTVAFLWRNYSVAEQARDLAIREVDRGDVELSGSVIRLSLTGSRGLATCALWMSAIDKQKRNQWNELEFYVRQVTKLQPNFVTPWLFQSWNLSYNVSVGSDRVNDKYFYITRGIELLADGERKNANNPDLRYWIGFYNQHKICKSDETNVQRSLFQLSLIPPNERDPARFKQINQATGVEEINWVEFEDFCKKHPQLVRRLHDGIIRETKYEADRQFTCGSAEQVIRFLADNLRVPSPWEDPKPMAVGSWQRRDDVLRSPYDRYPPLPPKRIAQPPQRIFDAKGLTDDRVDQLGDDIDAYAIARSWFAYAQEPIPDPDDMPGACKPITDRRLQRRPKQIMLLIFRNHPALAQSNLAERLQQEGWFDDELWPIVGWFPGDKFPADADGQRRAAKVGDESRKWSLEAWADAHERWEEHGKENHLIFRSTADEANKRQLDAEFRAAYNIEGTRPPELRVETLDPHMRECYEASHFMYENSFYRQVSNFDAHLIRALVDAKPEAVKGRKSFDRAERLRWQQASRGPALETYAAALPYWRDEVLLKNEDYRKLSFIMEETFDWQYRYLRLFDEIKGLAMRKRLAAIGRVMPLVPAVEASLNPEAEQPVAAYPRWVLQGPLDVLDRTGKPIFDEETKKHVLYRKPPTIPYQPEPKAKPSKTTTPSSPSQTSSTAEKPR